MKEKLAGKDYLFIGSMLFGLFFGAGNLIFPIHMGQEAGDAISQANFGFLVTAVGFPFLGIIEYHKVMASLNWLPESIVFMPISLRFYFIWSLVPFLHCHV